MRITAVLYLLLHVAGTLCFASPFIRPAGMQDQMRGAPLRHHRTCNVDAERLLVTDDQQSVPDRPETMDRRLSTETAADKHCAEGTKRQPAETKSIRKPRETEEKPGKWKLFTRVTATIAGFMLAIASLIRAFRRRD